MINLILELDNNESKTPGQIRRTKILFVLEVEKMTPEQIHVEVSTAIDKALRDEKEQRTG